MLKLVKSSIYYLQIITKCNVYLLHSRFELLQVQKRAKEEKKIYRRAIKEKEERILAQRGIKRLPKVERDSGEAIYSSYKLAKAKIKLIEALLQKSAGGPLVFRRV